MAFASVVRAIASSTLTKELINKQNKGQSLLINGIPRLPKGIVSSSLAKAQDKNLLVVCPTLEEAGRWAAQLEAMGWQTVNFYPTSEASPYDPFDPESEITWGQLAVISHQLSVSNDNGENQQQLAIVATERSLQPHLPPPEVFQSYCLTLKPGMEMTSQQLDEFFAKLGYERVNLVETEGQWSRRGDIVDIFPVSAELPVRLDWFGDELEQLKEFDPATQRSLDKLEQLLLTPTSFSHIIADSILANDKSVESYLDDEELDALLEGNPPEGMRRFLGLAFDNPVTLIDYLPDNTLITIDELEQCQAHGDRWIELAESQWQSLASDLPKIHAEFSTCLAKIDRFDCIYLSEIAEENPRLDITNPNHISVHNLQARPIPTTPHQFAKLAEILRGKREIYSGMTLQKY
ncbi:MAG: transcription-repair coupling factor, partial [Cyanobacteria bacterium J06638_38]